ncbi:MAG: Uma2 family endonuclease [Dehalococcoidia bacterium]
MVTILASREPVTDDCIDLENDAGWEFVDGELKERNVSFDSSVCGAAFLGAWYRLGVAPALATVAGSDLGYKLWPAHPRKVRKADASLVLNARVPSGPASYLTLPPDIAVEAVSPNDTLSEVVLKVEEWLAAGVRVVWVAIPESRQVHVYRSDAHPAILTAEDDLEVPDILPGFRVSVASLFPAWRGPAAGA